MEEARSKPTKEAIKALDTLRKELSTLGRRVQAAKRCLYELEEVLFAEEEGDKY